MRGKGMLSGHRRGKRMKKRRERQVKDWSSGSKCEWERIGMSRQERGSKNNGR